MRTTCWFILLLALLAAPAAAQDDTMICVGGPRWRASLDDVRRIDAEPIPASYRSLFESTAPCVRWALDEASLIDWHLRFGTERSVTPALAYLARDYLHGEPAPEAYFAELQRAWRTAQRDLRRAGTIAQPDGLNYSVRHRFTGASQPIRRLEMLVETRKKYVELAGFYLRAAEEFGSLALVETAGRLLGPAAAGAAFLAPLEEQPPVAGNLHFNLHIFRADDLELRAAVLRARLTRSADAIARAEAVLLGKERPHYARLAEQAFSGGDDFCDIGEGYNDRETLEAACEEDEDELQERVVSHALARAMLDLVVRPERVRWNGNSPAAMRLLDMERLPDRERCCRYSTNEDLLRLHLAAAESRRRLLAGGEAIPEGYGEEQVWFDALYHFQEAERLAPPFEAPGRFRRIAEAWLGVWRQWPALFPRQADGELPPTEAPDGQRYARYLERMLAALDEIAAGTN